MMARTVSRAMRRSSSIAQLATCVSPTPPICDLGSKSQSKLAFRSRDSLKAEERRWSEEQEPHLRTT